MALITLSIMVPGSCRHENSLNDEGRSTYPFTFTLKHIMNNIHGLQTIPDVRVDR